MYEVTHPSRLNSSAAFKRIPAPPFFSVSRIFLIFGDMSHESKRETSHLENISGIADNRSDCVNTMLTTTTNNNSPENRGYRSSDMPRTHWISPAFIGTYSAMGFTFMGTLGGFALFAPLQNDINNDLGPSSNIEVHCRCFFSCRT